MTQEQFNELLRSQQGELNAVLMYQRLAKVVKTDKEREAKEKSEMKKYYAKGDSTRNILVRPQAIKPKESLSYSVESSGTDSAVPQPVWKAALELPVFL